MSYSHPKHLTEELRAGASAAREALETLCREGLMQAWRKWGRRESGSASGAAMLHWVEMFLVSRSPAVLARLSDEPEDAWREFRCYVLVVACRWLLWPMPGEEAAPDEAYSHDFHSRFYWKFEEGGPPTLLSRPCPGGYELAMQQRSRQTLSGDLVQVVPCDGAVWLLTADAHGRGAAAHFLVQGFALLWRQAVNDAAPTPQAVFRKVQGTLQAHAPRGFFVTAALARLDRSGRMTVAAAGGAALLDREAAAGELEFQRLGGCLLGDVGYPELTFDERAWTLEAGREILISTNGFYEPAAGIGGAPRGWPGLRESCAQAPSLFEAAVAGAGALLQDDGELMLAGLRAY